MTDTTGPAGSQPTTFPPPPGVPPSLPAGSPAGRPTVWQVALIFAAAGLLAGGACAKFLEHPNAARSDKWALLFVLSVPLAAAAFVLLAFRLWRRRRGEAWPGLAQCLLIGVAGAVLAVGGCGGFALTVESSALAALNMGLAAFFVIGVATVVGAGELFLIGIGRLIFKRPGAR